MTLEDYRRFYAEEIGYAANVQSPALLGAFERVPRENFLGPGPWRIASFTWAAAWAISPRSWRKWWEPTGA
jgi:protein-L-isoaspartate O-methyltransferase